MRSAGAGRGQADPHDPARRPQRRRLRPQAALERRRHPHRRQRRLARQGAVDRRSCVLRFPAGPLGLPPQAKKCRQWPAGRLSKLATELSSLAGTLKPAVDGVTKSSGSSGAIAILTSLWLDGALLDRSLLDHNFLPHGIGGSSKEGCSASGWRRFSLSRRPSTRDRGGKLVWGEELTGRLHDHFVEQRRVEFEAFQNFVPNSRTFVELDPRCATNRGCPWRVSTWICHRTSTWRVGGSENERWKS